MFCGFFSRTPGCHTLDTIPQTERERESEIVRERESNKTIIISWNYHGIFY
jgi:hypothetical protein